MAEQLKYAVLGLGRAGWNIHVAGLRDRADAKIVAVVDPAPDRRKQALEELGAKGYETRDALLAETDADVIVVATPSVAHGPDTIAALKAGKHVVVEKPMSMNVAEADAMIKAANDAGKKLFVHQNYRFNPEFQYLLQVRDSGIIGRLYHIRNYITNFARRNDWQTLAKNGGGVLNNTCPHMIDQIMQLMGAPVVKVMGDLQQIASAGDVEDHVKAFLRASNGVTADMEVSQAQNISGLPKWILCGTHGTMELRGKEATIRYYDPNAVPKLEAQDGPAADRKYGNDDKLPWQEKTEPPVGPSIGNFYDNVYGVLREGKPMIIDPYSVREVIRVMVEIRKDTPFEGNA